ncbi:hypothetical protein N0V90_004830 [Kalmusia sp. IMI 367209]|nr:hypothetical protein N0V90_004830 [Kalmusia sp. IMI 367209]
MSLIYTERLNAENHTIRTVTLLPGSWNSPIRCLLKYVALDHASYNAISYAWGDPKDKASILVEEKQLAIPSNLEIALRYLRKPEEALELWIDAICINQQDVSEKAHQVAMMGEIFQRSTYTHIWLGIPNTINLGNEGEEEIDPFTLIRHFAADRHLYELLSVATEASSKLDPMFLSFANISKFKRIWDAFMDAVQKPWWSRFWCVQECLLSPTAIMVLGHWRVPWKTAKLCEINYKRHVLGCCSSTAGQLPEDFTFYADRTVTSTYLDSSRAVRVRAEVCSNLDLLVRSFRNKICQDPRDKLYGILGLADDSTKSELSVDYSLSTSAVYLALTKSILSSDPGNLRCLTGLGFNSSEHDLPSWVRNLDARPEIAALKYELTRFELYDLYNSANSTTATPLIQQHNLSTEGVFVDKIERVGKVVERGGWQDVQEVLQDWLNIADIDISSLKSQAFFLRPKSMSFWRTIVGDVVIENEQPPRRLTQDDLEALRCWLGSLYEAKTTGTNPGLLIPSMLAAIYGRAMFLTEQGYIGMCYPNSRVGDEVWILLGGRVPFVLRQIPQRENVGTVVGMPTRVLVGDCYLDEFMDGEAIRDTRSNRQSLLINR